MAKSRDRKNAKCAVACTAWSQRLNPTSKGKYDEDDTGKFAGLGSFTMWNRRTFHERARSSQLRSERPEVLGQLGELDHGLRARVPRYRFETREHGTLHGPVCTLLYVGPRATSVRAKQGRPLRQLHVHGSDGSQLRVDQRDPELPGLARHGRSLRPRRQRM